MLQHIHVKTFIGASVCVHCTVGQPDPLSDGG